MVNKSMSIKKAPASRPLISVKSVNFCSHWKSVRKLHST